MPGDRGCASVVVWSVTVACATQGLKRTPRVRAEPSRASTKAFPVCRSNTKRLRGLPLATRQIGDVESARLDSRVERLACDGLAVVKGSGLQELDDLFGPWRCSAARLARGDQSSTLLLEAARARILRALRRFACAIAVVGSDSHRVDVSAAQMAP